MKPKSIDDLLKGLGNPRFVLYGQDTEETLALKMKKGSKSVKRANRERALANRYGLKKYTKNQK
jgi:hypothetical protein